MKDTSALILIAIFFLSIIFAIISLIIIIVGIILGLAIGSFATLIVGICLLILTVGYILWFLKTLI